MSIRFFYPILHKNMYTFKLIKNEDLFIHYYNIKCDNQAILWSGFSKKPDFDRLKEVFNAIIKDDNQFLHYLIDENNDVVGYNHMQIIDNVTMQNRGHSVISKYQGKGLGTIIIQHAMEECKELGFKHFGGFISENNPASIKNVEKNGWYKTNRNELRELPALNRIDKFWFYQVDI